MFIGKTKRRKCFVGNVGRKLGWGERWHAIELVRSGELLLGLGSEITIHQIQSTSYRIEMEFETAETKGRMWVIFVYASIKERTRTGQWQELWTRKRKWEDKWILRGDFNDIRNPKEKSGKRPRSEASCKGFREFIENMNIE